jgi:hypothetical protein
MLGTPRVLPNAGLCEALPAPNIQGQARIAAREAVHPERTEAVTPLAQLESPARDVPGSY